MKIRARFYRIVQRNIDEDKVVTSYIPRGLVVGKRSLAQTTAVFGWSMCDDEDQFTKKAAWRVATDAKRLNILVDISSPQSIATALSSFPHSLHKTFQAVAGDMLRHLTRELKPT